MVDRWHSSSCLNPFIIESRDIYAINIFCHLNAVRRDLLLGDKNTRLYMEKKYISFEFIPKSK